MLNILKNFVLYILHKILPLKMFWSVYNAFAVYNDTTEFIIKDLFNQELVYFYTPSKGARAKINNIPKSPSTQKVVRKPVKEPFVTIECPTSEAAGHTYALPQNSRAEMKETYSPIVIQPPLGGPEQDKSKITYIINIYNIKVDIKIKPYIFKGYPIISTILHEPLETDKISLDTQLPIDTAILITELIIMAFYVSNIKYKQTIHRFTVEIEYTNTITKSTNIITPCAITVKTTDFILLAPLLYRYMLNMLTTPQSADNVLLIHSITIFTYPEKKI